LVNVNPNELIDLNETDSPQDDTIDLASPNPVSIVPETKETERRAKEAHYALGEKSPGENVLRSAIAAGDEAPLRDYAFWQREMDFRKEKLGIIDRLSRANQGPISIEDQEFIMGLSKEEIETNPGVVWETEFGRRVMLDMASAGYMDGYKVETKKGAVDMAEAPTEFGAEAIAKTRIANKLYGDMAAKWKSQSFVDKALDFGGAIVPGLQYYRTYNAVNQAPTTSLLLGNNVEEQIQYLYTLPPAEFERQFKSAVDDLASKNTLMALEFAAAVVSFAHTDRFNLNFMSVLDLTTPLDVAGIALGASRAARAARKAREIGSGSPEAIEASKDAAKAIADVTQAIAKHGHDPERIAEAAGQITDAGRLRVIREISEVLQQKATPAERMDFSKHIPHFFDPAKVMDRVTDSTLIYADRLRLHLEQQAKKLLGTLVDASNIERLTPDAKAVAFRLAEKAVHDEFKGTNDAIRAVTWVEAETNAPHLYKVDVELGKPDGTLFDDRATAWNFGENMYGLNAKDYQIKQQGGKYYIALQRNVDETKQEVRDALGTAPTRRPKVS
jgi:hypothetical protein